MFAPKSMPAWYVDSWHIYSWYVVSGFSRTVQ